MKNLQNYKSSLVKASQNIDIHVVQKIEKLIYNFVNFSFFYFINKVCTMKK